MGRPLKITHLTIYRDLPAGIRKQLRFEANAASHITQADWTVVAAHGGQLEEPFEKAIPRVFRFTLLRPLYGWLLAMRLSRTSDVLLLRHMPFDPFAFIFAPFIPNRVSIHHSKEIEELPLIRPGLTGRAAAWMERRAGRFAVGKTLGVLGVTGDIAEYQCVARSVNKSHATYSNGVDLDSVGIVSDVRHETAVNVVFMCETFSQWHGLDRLIDAVAAADHVPGELVIHLIGNLPEMLDQHLNSLGSRQKVFLRHGFMERQAYLEVLAKADLGLGSLALDRQNMIEGSTLKVREMLAMGLPVWANHKDTSLPSDFVYFHQADKVCLDSILGFAVEMKQHSRQQIRESAAKYVSKIAAMIGIIPWLASLLGRSDYGDAQLSDGRSEARPAASMRTTEDQD